MKILELVTRESLPHRNFFRTSEVSELLDIKPHEIRYWETEFPQIRPQKSKTGQRIYRRHDLVLFFAIKHLLSEKKMTLPAVQRIIAESDEVFITNKERNGKDLACSTPDVSDSASLPCSDAKSSHDEGISQSNVSTCQEAERTESLEDQVLEEASQLLNADEYNHLTHQIYQECVAELDDTSIEFEPHHVGEMLRNAIDQQSLSENKRMLRLEYEKMMAILIESKNSLTEVLFSLDKFRESDFWRGFEGRG